MDNKSILDRKKDFCDALDMNAEQFVYGVESLVEAKTFLQNKKLEITPEELEEFNIIYDGGIERIRETLETLNKWLFNATEFFVDNCLVDGSQKNSQPINSVKNNNSNQLPEGRDPSIMPWED